MFDWALVCFRIAMRCRRSSSGFRCCCLCNMVFFGLCSHTAGWVCYSECWSGSRRNLCLRCRSWASPQLNSKCFGRQHNPGRDYLQNVQTNNLYPKWSDIYVVRSEQLCDEVIVRDPIVLLYFIEIKGSICQFHGNSWLIVDCFAMDVL